MAKLSTEIMRDTFKMIVLYEINYLLLACITIFCYALGSISFGILIARFMNLGNLRSFGSGNIGATNVLRTGNKIAAAITLILDSGKGYLAIHLTTLLFDQAYLPLSGLAVFLGHIFPIYYKFKGGKGVATFLGIILAINAIIGLMTCITWVAIALLSRKSSLAALGCSIATPFFLYGNDINEPIILTLILALLIWWAHKDNIKRLISKTEPSINLKQAPQNDQKNI